MNGYFNYEGGDGSRTRDHGFADHCLTTWLHHHNKSLLYKKKATYAMTLKGIRLFWDRMFLNFIRKKACKVLIC